MDAMYEPPDFVYERPPLIEVIVEVQWSLTPISLAPGAAVDPGFADVRDTFLSGAKEEGLIHLERLVPSEIPLELLAHQPVFRLRRQQNQWPLYQLGPGLFTANIVPPYKGWKEFRTFVSSGLQLLRNAFDASDSLFKCKRLELKYLNGFVREHTYVSAERFINDALGFDFSLNEEVEKQFRRDEGLIRLKGEAAFRVAEQPDRELAFRFGSGKKDSIDAFIYEIKVATFGIANQKLDDVIEWMDMSHNIVRQVFDQSVSDEIKKTFGNRQEIREEG